LVLIIPKLIQLKIFTLCQILAIGTRYSAKSLANTRYSAKFGTGFSPSQVPVNSWISSVMPRVFAGLELEHLALPERKFEQFSGFCEAKLSVPVSSSPQLDSHSGIQSAISFGNRNAVSMGYWSQG